MWSAEQNISQAGKGVFHKIPAFPVMSLTKILETFIRSFPSSFNGKYVHTVACTVVFVGPTSFVCNAYPGCNATCLLSRSSNKDDGHAVALTVACKGPFCVEVLSSLYGRFFVKEGQFINSTLSLHLCNLLFICWRHLALACWIVKASHPEVNQFSGNCFCVVRIVLNITFLKLRYPGQRP